MFDETTGQPFTAQTTNLVPFIMVGNDVKNIKLNDGSLCDIAPTILFLMGLDIPSEMTGNILIKNRNANIFIIYFLDRGTNL